MTMFAEIFGAVLYMAFIAGTILLGAFFAVLVASAIYGPIRWR